MFGSRRRRRRATSGRRWWWVLAFFIAVPAALAASGYAWLATSLPEGNDEAEIPGLTAPVTVLRDSAGVPHIFAATPADAFGFVHAQDRLWQMEAMRRLGAGRLSEVVGPAALPTDRFMRRLGLHRLAENQAAALRRSPVRDYLEAYAAGVNAWLATHGGALPPEFVALRFAPEPWRPADSLVWARIMATRLSRERHRESLRARLAQRLSPRQVAELWPPYPPTDPVTVAALRDGGFVFDDAMPATIPMGASNVWAVSGARTATGKPILANDPHLRLRAPILWYLARIVTPEWEITGATSPGVPFVVLGHNQRMAWGMTNTNSDFEDLFVERIDPADPDRYIALGGALPFTSREEVIRVKGEDDEVLTVRATRHGPVIRDVDDPDQHRDNAEPGTVVAVSATYLRSDDRSAEGLMAMGFATDWDTFVRATRDFHSPQQNIGLLVPGRVPVRRGGNGVVPAPGWTGEYDWQGFLPFEALPRAFNPPSGLIVNANNKVVPDGYPWFLGENWDDGYRARRITDLVDAAPRAQTLNSTAAIQLDTVSLMARDILPLMLARTPETGSRTAVLAMLGQWTGEMSRRRPEPLVFTAWLRAFNAAVYGDELGPLLDGYWGHRPRFITHVLERNPAWCDDVTTAEPETCADRLGDSLDQTIRDLSERFEDDPRSWRWGDVHTARLHHRLLGRIPLLGRLVNTDIPTDGGFYTVNRGAHWLGNAGAPYAHVHGAGLRAIYDLADLSRSRFMIATGQSGNPLSRHFRDLVEPWRDGRWLTLGLDRESLEQGGHGRLTLRPR